MITEDLVAYIQSQTKKNIPKERIVARLSQVGWHPDDIAEGFAKLAQSVIAKPPVATTITEVNPTPRPLPLVTPVRTPATPASISSEPKVWVPMSVNSLATGGKPLPVENKLMQEVSVPARPIQEIPKTVPVVTDTTPVAKEILPAGLAIAFGGQPSEVSVPTVVSTVAPVIAPVVPTQPAISPIAVPVQEPSVVVQPVQNTAPIPVPQKDSSPVSITSMLGDQKPMTRVPVDDTLSRRAMIASYKEDSLSVNQSITVASTNSTKIVKKALVGLGVLIVIGGGVFALAAGLVKIPNFTAAIVKKDPRDALLEASTKLDSLHYYKSSMSIDVTSPSFAAITSGLVTGNSVKSGDLESVSIDAQGEVSGGGPMTPPLSVYTGTLKSSLLMDDIASSWSYDGSTSYIDVPSLSELFPNLAPPPTTVAIDNGQFDLLLPELSPTVQDLVKKYDVFDIVSKGVSPYMQSQTAASLKDFLSTVTVSEKDDEVIHAVPTYHYSLAASQPATKKLLTDLLAVTIAPLSDSQNTNVTEALGSVSVDSFDVWVGKDDGILHQYDIALSIPLSKVIALDDKGIAGKEVTFHIKDTFYDFDTPNDIHMPTSSTTMSDFVKSIRDTKVKSLVYGFIPTAKNLANAEGGYGRKPNTTYSCTNPVPGTLFSPIGHSAGASSQVGAIASTMSTLMSTTNNTGFCYSTPSAWALAAPLASNPQAYYCADSTGATTVLTSALSGTVCK